MRSRLVGLALDQVLQNRLGSASSHSDDMLPSWNLRRGGTRWPARKMREQLLRPDGTLHTARLLQKLPKLWKGLYC